MILDNFSRQTGWFSGNQYNKEIHVIGCGATGSWVAMQLAKMGVTKLHLWDFDVVEEHNVANQVFGMGDLGKTKTDALAQRIKADTGFDVTIHTEPFTSDKKAQLKGVVFVLTDTMSSRSDIWKACRFNPMISLVVETRMGIECGRIYTLDPMDAQRALTYEKTLYDDDVAETSFCGSSLSIVNTAMNIASLAVWSVVKDFKGMEQSNEVLIDYTSNNMIESKF